MLEKPEIQDETIIACLRAEYGLPIHQITFLPLGGDLCSAVYRAVAGDGAVYFCKLRCADFDEISVELPRFLSEQGIAQIISPIVTKSGGLWAELAPFHLILYPFIEGTSGFEIELTGPQWTTFATALRRIHSTGVPPALAQKIQKEGYSSEWRDTFRSAIRRLDEETFTDPITLSLVKYLRPKRETILDLLGHAHQLAQALSANPPEWVLCHTDIHPGNLFIDTHGTLYIIDWDYPVLAPKERDLMFIGGGQGYMNTTPQKEETLFYGGYGPGPIDPIAMAYYRCERNIVDLSVECTRIFSSTVSDQDRAQSLQIITWLFLPEGSIEMAYQSIARLQ
ncbi:MAG: aminoglycoside phosphotransferase family protein [Anaerolineaceae bacterium]|nr:aminoglycoside phosphotransferase family protein [Anaerolineaceae bacterium]